MREADLPGAGPGGGKASASFPGKELHWPRDSGPGRLFPMLLHRPAWNMGRNVGQLAQLQEPLPVWKGRWVAGENRGEGEVPTGESAWG